MIAKITPIYTRAKKFKLTFEEAGGSEHVEKPTFFEGETEKFPTTFPLAVGSSWKCYTETLCTFAEKESLGAHGEFEITTSEEMEIKA